MTSKATSTTDFEVKSSDLQSWLSTQKKWMPSKHAKQTGHSCGRFVLMAAGDNVVLPAYLPVGRRLFRRLYLSSCTIAYIASAYWFPITPHLWRLSVAKKIMSKHCEGFLQEFCKLVKTEFVFLYPGGPVITFSSAVRNWRNYKIRISKPRAGSLFCCDNRRLCSIRWRGFNFTSRWILIVVLVRDAIQ